MDVKKKRVNGNKISSGSVAAGSVWESRMKRDEVEGGIKVFNGEENNSEESNDGSEKNNDKSAGAIQVSKSTQRSVRRKTWGNSEGFEGVNKSPIQGKKLELSVSVDNGGASKSPMQGRKMRSDGLSSLDGSSTDLKSPIQLRKTRSEAVRGLGNGDGSVKNSGQLRKLKSESGKIVDWRNADKSLVELKKHKSEPKDAGKKSSIGLDEANPEANNRADEEIEKNQIEIQGNGSEEAEEEPQEKVISSSESNVGLANSSETEMIYNEDHEDVDYETESEIEMEKKSIAIKEIDVLDQKIKNDVSEEDKKIDQIQVKHEDHEDVDHETESEIEMEKKSVAIKGIDVSDQKIKNDVSEDKKIGQIQVKQKSVQSNSAIAVNKQPAFVKRSAFFSDLNKSTAPNLSKPTTNFTKPKPTLSFRKPSVNITKPTPVANSYESQSIPTSHSRLQGFVELVMWRDVSRSAFVFGMGTFIIVSSSYTNDLNISLISVISYLGLIYLALTFVYRSIICRGRIGIEELNRDYVVGEEEAIWILRRILPYLNEFLLSLKALFSGDPATTMKLAAVLFVFAKCGSSITIWRMVKLGFFGVFTVPKICSAYSAQITGYGKFWVRRFRDAWESCTHKKAVGFAIFTLVWNLCSIVARIWAVFMLVVAVRCYQQSTVVVEEWVDDEPEYNDTCQKENAARRTVNKPRSIKSTKTKKGF